MWIALNRSELNFPQCSGLVDTVITWRWQRQLAVKKGESFPCIHAPHTTSGNFLFSCRYRHHIKSHLLSAQSCVLIQNSYIGLAAGLSLLFSRNEAKISLSCCGICSLSLYRRDDDRWSHCFGSSSALSLARIDQTNQILFITFNQKALIVSAKGFSLTRNETRKDVYHVNWKFADRWMWLTRNEPTVSSSGWVTNSW